MYVYDIWTLTDTQSININTDRHTNDRCTWCYSIKDIQ